MKEIREMIAARPTNNPSKEGDKGRSVGKETERGELFRWFMTQLNPDRQKNGYIPLTFGRMGKLLEKIPTKDLYFIQTCMKDRDYERAARYFWWSLKPHEENEPQ